LNPDSRVDDAAAMSWRHRHHRVEIEFGNFGNVDRQA